MSRLPYVLFAVLLIVLGCVSGFAAPADSSAVNLTLRSAGFVASNAPAPPSSGWTTVALPDNWTRSHPGLGGFAWYQLHFRLDQVPDAPLALYVPHVSLVGTFYLNGSLINADARFDRPHGRMGSDMGEKPLYLVLPSGLFHAGDNVLNVRLQGSAHLRSGISAIQIAPASTLEGRQSLRTLLQVTLPSAVLVIIVGALIFLAAHLWHRRSTHLIQLVGLLALALIISYMTVSFPVSREAQVFVRVVTHLTLVWALVVVGYRLSEHKDHWFLPLWHTLSAGSIVAAVLCYALGITGDPMWMVIWPHTLLRFIVLYWMFQAAWRTRSFRLGALAFSGAFWNVTTVQSGFILLDWLSWDSIRLSTSGVVPLCLVLLFVFAEQFILDREQAAAAQRDALATERNRILQEMHDGMGAHLITALHLARRDDVDRATLVGSIEQSIQDMRSIIDSLDVAGHDLVPLLANLRSRLEPRLAALGIRLFWGVVLPLPKIDHLTPETALAILRIIQESVNNAIQHAHAQTLRIAAMADGDDIRIEIADDGRGFDPGAVRDGTRGLTGLFVRARTLYARVEILSSTQGVSGTTVILRIPRSIAASQGGRRKTEEDNQGHVSHA